ncbi:MAG: Asp-tRNA(Asn)/Glu-tRNA(Gln) amidotransferase subunit GatC [Candidatus Vogelbacteria bacterium]
MIRREEVINLAALARLELQDSEVEPLRHDLEAILGYVAQLKVEVTAPPLASRTRSLTDNALRVDGQPHPADVFTEQLLTVSPKQRDGYIVVKPIFPQDAN